MESDAVSDSKKNCVGFLVGLSGFPASQNLQKTYIFCPFSVKLNSFNFFKIGEWNFRS